MTTSGFHFGVPMEVCGKTYYIDLNRPGVKDKIKQLGADIQTEIAKATETDDLSGVIEKTKAYIDTILGDGSYDEIFSGRVANPFDMASLYNYIADVVMEQSNRLKNAKRPVRNNRRK